MPEAGATYVPRPLTDVASDPVTEVLAAIVGAAKGRVVSGLTLTYAGLTAHIAPGRALVLTDESLPANPRSLYYIVIGLQVDKVLANNATNYLYLTATSDIIVNQSGVAPAHSIPLYSIVTAGGAVTGTPTTLHTSVMEVATRLKAPGFDAGGQEVLAVGAPTLPTSAVRQQDLTDSLATLLGMKNPVRAATTAAITLAGLQTVDGVVLASGDRVLVKNQAAAATNGIYVVQSGAWQRATDFDSSAEITAGALVYVQEGTTNAKLLWMLATTGTIVLGTTALTFENPLVPVNAVTNTRLADMAQATIKGRTAGAGTGDPVDLTAAQVIDILETADGPGSGLDADTVDGLQATSLGRLVASPSSGGAGDTGYWIRVATLPVAGNFNGGSVTFAVTVSEASNTTLGVVLVEAGIRQDGGIVEAVWIGLIGRHRCGMLTDDSFKIVSSGYDGAHEIWMQKKAEYGLFRVFLLAEIYDTAVTTTWHTGQAWQAVEPVGAAANARSAGLRYGTGKVWHEANDGAGSGLDADLLDGADSATAATPNTIPKRGAGGQLAVGAPQADGDAVRRLDLASRAPSYALTDNLNLSAAGTTIAEDRLLAISAGISGGEASIPGWFGRGVNALSSIRMLFHLLPQLAIPFGTSGIRIGEMPTGVRLSITGVYKARSDSPFQTTYERFAIGLINSTGNELGVPAAQSAFGIEDEAVRDDVPSIAVVVDDAENIKSYSCIAGGDASYVDSTFDADLNVKMGWEVILEIPSAATDLSTAKFTVKIQDNSGTMRTILNEVAPPFAGANGEGIHLLFLMNQDAWCEKVTYEVKKL